MSEGASGQRVSVCGGSAGGVQSSGGHEGAGAGGEIRS